MAPPVATSTPTPITTSVEPIEDNKVRLHVAVPAVEFEKAVDAAFRKLGQEVKIPGFRPGKVPRQLLEARLGTEVAREQALQDALPRYYADAVDAEDLDTIAPPDIDITAGRDDGDIEFDAVVEVRPVVDLSGYDELTVEIPSPAVSDELIDEQVDGLRDRFAELEDSTAPLADGHYAQIDVKGYVHDEVVDAASASDFLYEVGSGGLVPRLDEELRGKRPGDILRFNDTLPERMAERAGDEVAFQVLVKETKRKLLPDATDEWASEVSEFDTVADLRADMRRRLELLNTVRAQVAARDSALQALAELVDIEVPDALVSQEMERRAHDLVHRLEEQGISLSDYLAATGQDQDAFLATVRASALIAARADLALRAVITQEEIAPTDEEVDAEIGQMAERMGEPAAKVRDDLGRRGLLEAVRSELQRAKAVQFLVDHATITDPDGTVLDLTLPRGEEAEGATVEGDGPAAAPQPGTEPKPETASATESEEEPEA